GPRDLEPLAANGRSFGLHDLGLVVYDEPQRPAHGHHGEGFERRVEREAAQTWSPEKKWAAPPSTSGTTPYGTSEAKARQDLGLRPSRRRERPPELFQLILHGLTRRPTRGCPALHAVFPGSKLG